MLTVFVTYVRTSATRRSLITTLTLSPPSSDPSSPFVTVALAPSSLVAHRPAETFGGRGGPAYDYSAGDNLCLWKCYLKPKRPSLPRSLALSLTPATDGERASERSDGEELL